PKYEGEPTLGFNTLNINGATVSVESGKNVFDFVATEINAGELSIAEGAELTIRATVATNEAAQGSEADAQALIAQNGQVTVNGGVVNNAGTLTLQAGEVNVLNVVDGEVNNTGVLDVNHLNIAGGTVNTVYTRENFKWTEINLTGGTLNLAQANSVVGVLFNAGQVNLHGGVLAVNGEAYTGGLKIGRSKTKADVTVKGTYRFDSVEFGSSNGVADKAQSTLTVNAGGNLTIGSLDLKFGQTFVEGNGTLTVGNLFISETNADGTPHTLATKGELNVQSEGTLITDWTNLIAIEETDDSVTLSQTEEGKRVNLAEDAMLEVTGSLTLTADQVKQFNGLYSGFVNFADLTLNANEGDTNISWDAGLGLAGKDSVIAATGTLDVDTGTMTLENATGATVAVGAISLEGNEDVKSLAFADGEVIFNTKNGQEIVAESAGVLESISASDIVLGMDDKANGVVNAKTLTTETLVVNGTFDASAATVELTGDQDNSVVAKGANFIVEKITSVDDHELQVDGSLKVNDLAAKTEVHKDGSLTVKTISAAVASAVGSVISTSENGVEKIAQVVGDFDPATKAGLFVDGTVTLGAAGQLNVGTYAPGQNGVVVLGQNSVTVIDLTAFDDKTAIFKAAGLVAEEGVATLAEGDAAQNASAQVVLKGADKVASYVLVEGGAAAVEPTGVENVFLKAEIENAVDQATLNIVYNDEALKGTVGSIVGGLYNNGMSAANAAVLAAVGTNFADAGKLSAKGEAAVAEYMKAPVTAGVYNVAMDATEEFTRTMTSRTLEAGTGYGVWANVYYGSTSADEIFGNSGYEADIYGGVIGADATFKRTRLGLALTMGTGDADSVGTVGKYSLDSDFWGVAAYAGHDFGSVRLTSDIAYLEFDNDIGGSVVGASVGESIDSSVFTFGWRAEMDAYKTKLFSVVPHVGLRFAQVKADEYRGFNTGDLNVTELPIGVTVAGNFEAAGMKLIPSFDLTGIVQLGDKEVSTVLGNADVLGNVYEAAVGIEAEMDAFTFGLNYRYGFGSDSRSNSSANLKATYRF
ncbi:MAG: autotransporter outer membrane beta-barrel domain-containing protein, partial [Sutterellaceae bacterium]|nr:autotransporter outer membrane beta-barrel domain-containing protein [Sutterellaceae bacterium]